MFARRRLLLFSKKNQKQEQYSIDPAVNLFDVSPMFVAVFGNVGKRILQPGRPAGSSTLQNLLRAKVWRCCVSLAPPSSVSPLSCERGGPCFLVTLPPSKASKTTESTQEDTTRTKNNSSRSHPIPKSSAWMAIACCEKPNTSLPSSVRVLTWSSLDAGYAQIWSGLASCGAVKSSCRVPWISDIY